MIWHNIQFCLKLRWTCCTMQIIFALWFTVLCVHLELLHVLLNSYFFLCCTRWNFCYYGSNYSLGLNYMLYWYFGFCLTEKFLHWFLGFYTVVSLPKVYFPSWGSGLMKHNFLLQFYQWFCRVLSCVFAVSCHYCSFKIVCKLLACQTTVCFLIVLCKKCTLSYVVYLAAACCHWLQK